MTHSLKLHIVEPTLVDSAGHCYFLTKSLALAWQRQFSQSNITVWAGQISRSPLESAVRFPVGVLLKQFFHRPLRRLQLPWLLWRLVRRPGVVFVSTARAFDLLVLYWVLPRINRSSASVLAKVCVYFHWVRMSEKKGLFFRKFALVHPKVSVFATTPVLAQHLSQAGLPTIYLPYPIASAVERSLDMSDIRFRHLLYAGAARLDKGFDRVATLATHLVDHHFPCAIRIQVTGEKRMAPEANVAPYIRRLKTLAENAEGYLELVEQTPAEAEYQHQFTGAVVLQLYQQNEFADRVSGVTLDAISQGAPIIAVEGTWTGRVVARFGCGVVLSNDSLLDIRRLEAAVWQCIDQWVMLHQRSLVAAKQLQREMTWKPLFEQLDECQTAVDEDPS